ncbi:serine hydrolase [Stigmatella sp. ncwal1]|uniref:Serine hydrolase n=1 Tax=Stigmatella ashevillensis TaxID=2995309 RepID=A0ABT5DEC3_9BACT|nr:serine hydrolase domain-containing protein [Stigmatella ashevillena]MDC0711414.1 serine hydrolase [Stigmatella ashevillena]
MKGVAVCWALLLAFSPPSAAEQPVAPAAFLSAIDGFVREQNFSGTILVEERGIRLYQGSFGLANRAFAVPTDLSTRYKIASITKLFTSVLILQLQQEGKLDLKAKIRTYLPDFTGDAADRVTLHQLLNHTSGMAQFDTLGSYQEAFEKGIPQYQRPTAVPALLALCCSGKLVREPGTEFDYNNGEYFILGAIIERLTGLSYEDALAARILKPLGLKDTGMMHWDEIVSRLAPSYFYREDSKTLINDMPVYYENWYAAGGMYSTVTDLARFADALFGGRLLKPTALDLLLAPGLDDYGYGLWSYTLQRGGKPYQIAKRPGRIMGANSVLYRLRGRNATIVILANTNRADLDVFAQRIADILVR